ncbi:MAG: 23S rRNA (uracil(1939)-C(5))-methyltransferase RlmD [Candidatus Omnitrophica bacterium]|nr:23S rRNA (uracil(1939)-C(5))-methyltransferase RlmD [Candidatus Omnitrophota bacterium]
MKNCKHFGDCGGCRFQDIPYKEQLALKQKQVEELAAAIGAQSLVKPIQSGKEWFYRGKMEFTFRQQEDIACGLYSRRTKGKVVDIEECLIFSQDAPVILKAIKEFIKQKGYSAYNKYKHKGFLRNLVLRETKFTNQIMLGIVTTSNNSLDKEEFIKILLGLKLKSKIVSIYWIVNDSWSDAVIFEKKELLRGEPFIQETLGDLKFKIGIDSFFQSNPRMIASFYEKIGQYANVTNEKNVLDIFCGLGSIGIFLADKAKYVWGVEIAPEAIDLARKNAELNGKENITFTASDARKFLNTQGVFHRNKTDLLVVNPPRCGLSNKILRAIFRLNPKEIIYSSCNPKALFSDLQELTKGYSLESIEPFDFFPHTPHLECLTFLKRI